MGDCDACITSVCATEQVCGEQVKACAATAECADFDTCLAQCGYDQACKDQCHELFPQGAALWITAVDCVLCHACAKDCDADGKSCPFEG